MDLKRTSLGIELGSTRIKSVLIDDNFNTLAQGSFEWENSLIKGIWTYSLQDALAGVKACYKELKKEFENRYNQKLDTIGSIGISGMMHGYLAFDKDFNQIGEFRTWRNTITATAAEKLTALFDFNIPQRWSIAHFYQAYLNKEAKVDKIKYLTTLAGYVHYLLTDRFVLGIGEASGMFPIDSEKMEYRADLLEKMNSLITDLPYQIQDILPEVLLAGQEGGCLTAAGALLLDESGDLKPGVRLCPPEGDAGTGMVGTNSVGLYTGNVSAGTSDFAMIVVDHQLGVHKEIDMVTTPAGLPVAMVHCNNCTSDINSWVNLFKETIELMGQKVDVSYLYTRLFQSALSGDSDCGNLVSYNYFSGEGVTEFDEGRPLLIRKPDSKFTISNFMKTTLFSSLATLKIGLDLLNNEEKIRIDRIYGHGGFFKTPVVGQSILSAAIKAPVLVNQSAGEGGPYGMALLANYLFYSETETLDSYLNNRVFKDSTSSEVMADEALIADFDSFVEKYKNCLSVEAEAIRKG